MATGREFFLGKCMNFSVRVVRLRQYLVDEKREYDISKQLLRSGTSIGANMNEAQSSISDKDFISKAFIALKECRESLYWIELLYRTDYLEQNEYESLYSDCEEILKLLTTVIKTKKANMLPTNS